MARIPGGVIPPEQVSSEAASLLLTYRNFGDVDVYGADLQAEYQVTDRWNLGAAVSVVNDDRFTADSGSLAAFLTDRDRYYAESPWGALRCARIDHGPWPLYRADVTVEENTLFAADGFAHPETEPVHYYSPGVTTTASRSHRV